MVPVAVPQTYIKILNSLLMNYIWKNKRQRISAQVLKPKKKTGGLAVPDISKYYVATVLARIIEWAKENPDKRWINIECALARAQLGRIIWNPPQHRTLDTSAHEITFNALRVWDRVHKQLKSKFNSPLMDLKDNEYFAPGTEGVGGNWIKNRTQVRDIIQKGKILTHHEIKAKIESMRLDEWRYMQLALFIKRLPLPLRPREDYTPIEKLCITDSSKGNISKIYRFLFKREELEIPKYILKCT